MTAKLDSEREAICTLITFQLLMELTLKERVKVELNAGMWPRHSSRPPECALAFRENQ
jgi:hypothetical protein